MDGKAQVMVVEDDPSMCTFLRAFLGDRGYQAITLGSAEEAVERYKAERPAAVILDVVMPGSMDGLAALAAFKKIDHDVPVIVLSGQGRTATVVQAMQLGASDFVSKPFEDPELEGPLTKALRQHQVSRGVAALREQLRSQSEYRVMFGHSERMAAVQDLIERVTDTDVTVLIRGERGTGKELVARALHASSLRRDRPFVRVNCAALPRELVEWELFGFERGAFTGAIQQKPGKFEFANNGTMFLDEIGEMSGALQAKLLQVLQSGEFSRLGGSNHIHVDVRIVAATHKDLERAAIEGQFLDDLFVRLGVISINMPPLRERREEIPVLCDYFLKKYAVQNNKPFAELSPETMRLFLEHDWPGNIRELENLIKRAVVLGTEESIRKEIHHHLVKPAHAVPAAPPPTVHSPAVTSRPAAAMIAASPTSIAAAAAEAGNYSLKDISRTAAREAERALIFKMLQQTRWNRKATAEILGISYKALLYKIKENGLDKAS